jgi:hypothetical protein
MVKSVGVPKHVFAEGVTVITPKVGNAPEFAALKDAIFPIPEAPKPIVEFEFVQL